MAVINEMITLGIGTPSDIKSFILFGLQPHAAVANKDGAEFMTFGWIWYAWRIR